MNDILIVTDPYAYTDADGEAQKRLLWIALHIPMSCNIMNTITMIDELMAAWASAGQSRLDWPVQGLWLSIWQPNILSIAEL